MTAIEDIENGGHLVPEVLGDKASEILRVIGWFAADCGVKAYLVGGLVRDLLLGSGSSDIDIMFDSGMRQVLARISKSWESSLPGFALPRSPLYFPRFFTAKLEFEDEVIPGVTVIDFSEARTEIYSCSGAQPDVSLGTVIEDARRRDFSVNALAMALTGREFGNLFDYCEGRQDLVLRVLRVMHRNSFVDDPARILRGVRLEVRLGFSFEKETLGLVEEARDSQLLGNLPKFRLFEESMRSLRESQPECVLKRMADLGLLSQVFPASSFVALASEKVVEEIKQVLLLSQLLVDDFSNTAKCYNLSRELCLERQKSPLEMDETIYSLLHRHTESEVFSAWLDECRVKGRKLKRFLALQKSAVQLERIAEKGELSQTQQ